VRRHIPGATRIEATTASTPPGAAEQHPVVQAALGIFQGEVVAVKPRDPEGGATP